MPMVSTRIVPTSSTSQGHPRWRRPHRTPPRPRRLRSPWRYSDSDALSVCCFVTSCAPLRRALALALSAVLVAAGTTAAHADSYKSIWGPVRMPDGTSAFPIYRDLGVRILQLRLTWANVAPERPANPTDPSDPAYRWPAEFDEAVRLGERHGIRLMLQVMSSPAWANGGRAPEWVPDNAEYASFLVAASRRYPSIRHWMIWGEPNRAAVFQPMPDDSPVGPRRYATLLDAAYGTLKGLSPHNRVIGGMSLSFGEVMPGDYLRWMRLPNGKPPPLDLWGHNPLSPRFPAFRQGPYPGEPRGRDFSELDAFNRELTRTYRGQYPWFRRRGPRLWLSEFTIPSDGPNHIFPYFVRRGRQAEYVTAAYRIAHRTPFIAGLGWIGLLDEPVSVPDHGAIGLMTYEGEKKPAYRAYRRAR